jgi:hypothetical protein
MRLSPIIGCSLVSLACLLASCDKSDSPTTPGGNTDHGAFGLSITGGYACSNVQAYVAADTLSAKVILAGSAPYPTLVTGNVVNGSDTINFGLNFASQ